MNRLSAQWDVAKTRLAAALTPAIVQLTGALSKFAEEINELASNPKFITFVENAAEGFGRLGSKIAYAAERLAHYIDEHRQWAALGGGAAQGVGGALVLGGLAAPFTGGASLLGAAALVGGGAALGVGGFALQQGLRSSGNSGGAAGRLQALLAGQGEEIPLNSPLRLLGSGEGGGGGVSIPAKDNKSLLNQQLQDFIAEQRLELAEANTTADAEAKAKIAMLQNVANEALRLSKLANTPAEANKLIDAARTANAQELQERVKYIDQLKKLDAEEIATEEKGRIGALDVAKSQLALEAAAHQVTKVQELQAEQDLVDKKYALELTSLSQQQALYDQGTRDYEKYTEQLITTAEKWRESQLQIAAQIAAAQQEAAQKTQEEWQSALAPIASTIDSTLRSVITGQQSPLAALSRGAGDLILGGLSKTVQGVVVGGQGGENGQPGDLAAGDFQVCLRPDWRDRGTPGQAVRPAE